MIYRKNNQLFRRNDKELLMVEDWGKNRFRVRATQRSAFLSDELSALLPAKDAEADSSIDGDRARIVN